MDTRQAMSDLVDLVLGDPSMRRLIHQPSAELGFAYGLRLARTYPEWAAELINANAREYLSQASNPELTGKLMDRVEVRWGEYINQHPIEDSNQALRAHPSSREPSW